LAKDITSGLAFLHGRGLLHLDLKAENVLLHRNEEDTLIPTAMLSDFGSSEARNAINRQQRSGVTGTLDYLAPEAFEVLPNGRPRQHAAALDLWALGLILHLLAFFALPYERTDIDGLTDEILHYRG
jgi:serine/threonine protein kinase